MSKQNSTNTEFDCGCIVCRRYQDRNAAQVPPSDIALIITGIVLIVWAFCLLCIFFESISE